MILVWTKEPPTEPGWYWARTKQEFPKVAMVYVDGTAPFLEMKTSLEWGGLPSSHIGRPFHVWQWAGGTVPTNFRSTDDGETWTEI